MFDEIEYRNRHQARRKGLQPGRLLAAASSRIGMFAGIACLAFVSAMVACSVRTGGGGSSRTEAPPGSTGGRISAVAEAACVPSCTDFPEDVEEMYDVVEDHRQDGLSSDQAVQAVLDVIAVNHPDSGDGPSRAELCQPCVETVASEVYADTAPPTDDGDQPDTPTDEEGDLDLTFPDTGDALVIGTDETGAATVTVYGSVNEETEEATVTGMDVVTEDGTATATVDDQGRLTEILMDTLAVTATYNADGTANLALAEAGDVLLSEDNVLLEAPEEFPETAGAVGWAIGTATEGDGECCPGWVATAKDTSRRSSSRSIAEYVNTQRGVLAEGSIAQLGYNVINESAFKKTPFYECVELDAGLNRQLRLWCRLQDFLDPLLKQGLHLCGGESYPRNRCEAIVGLAFKLAWNYRNLLKWANQGLVAQAWDDDPACWCGGPADCPQGWDCVDTHCLPKCRSNFDCVSSAWTCDPSTGRCVRQLTAKQLAGCWKLTLTDSLGSATIIIQIDANGQLERVWRIDAGTSSRTVETTRFTIPEPPVWQSIRRSMSQSITVTAQGWVEIRQTIENNGYGEDANGVCKVDTSKWTRGEWTIQATVAGDPPARLEAGTFTDQAVTRYPDSPELDRTMTFNGKVVGTRQSACPDPADANVYSQEEWGSPCRRCPP